MRKFLNLLLLAVVAMSLSGCASIVCGTKQSVNFTSTPTNATIYDNGVLIGNTPLAAKLERKNNHLISIKLDGYQPFEVEIKKEFNAWYLGNILFGGIIGLVVDPITGAIYKLSPEQIGAQMGRSTGAAFDKKGDSIYISISLEKNPEWEQIGSLASIE